MQGKIDGSVMQSLTVFLNRGESVYTEAGGMAWMTDGIEMTTNTRGGLMKGLGRTLAGESLFMTTYTCNAEKGWIVFTPEAPGKVVELDLAPGQSYICQKDSFMVADSTVEMKMHFRKRLGAGFFGGEGFILQEITGPGKAYIEVPGEVVTYNLQPNQMIKVDPGHIAAFEPTVNYDIQTVKGLSNILFSGEGLFLASLRGPGKVLLQTMPISNLAAKIAKYIPSKG
ncbi:MAG: TIGR00266 family protein [Anaerolineaceae bacterium]|nr:TIGR00266 family protein [Anaerolineaceae bacterium]